MSDRYFVFDFDGVLSDSLKVALEEYQNIIVRDYPMIPVPRTRDDLVALFPGPLRTSLRRFGLDSVQSQTFFDLHSAAMRDRSDEIEVFAPVVECLLRTPSNRRSIVTSAYSDVVRSVLSRCGFGTSDVQIYGRELSLPKSDKFRLVAADNGVHVSAMVKICDMVSDILYAHSANVPVWSVGWGYHPLPYLAAFGPSECIETHSQLDDMMRG